MKKPYMLWIWTLVFAAQFAENLTLCKKTSSRGETCTYENLFQPYMYQLQRILPKHVAHLNFNNNLIPKLSRDTFIVPNGNVIQLSITNSQVSDIDTEGLTMFPKLTKLNLDYNNLTQIGSRVFHAQTELTELTLSHNDISWIDTQAFYLRNASDETLFRVKLLDLSFNSLTKLANVFDWMMQLEKLDLSNNKLQTLDRRTFRHTGMLLSLNLSKNNLAEVKFRNFDSLSNLVSLNLSNNLLSKLELGFAIGLKSLKTLDLSSNRLSVLDPNEFYHTKLLENLHLHNNFLKTLAIVDLKANTNLKTISIHDNEMECSVLLKLLKEIKWQQVIVDEGSETETYSFHGISCNFISTTEKYNEIDLEKVERVRLPTITYSFKDLEEAFVNSSFYLLFKDFVTNQKERLDAIVRTMKEINGKLAGKGEGIIFPV